MSAIDYAGMLEEMLFEERYEAFADELLDGALEPDHGERVDDFLRRVATETGLAVGVLEELTLADVDRLRSRSRKGKT